MARHGALNSTLITERLTTCPRQKSG